MNIRFILYNIIHFLPLSNFIFPPAKHKKFTLPLRGCGIVIYILRFLKGVLFSRAPAARENGTGSREGVRAMPKFSVKKPLTVFVAVVAVLVLGVVSYLKMTPDLLPNMDFPYIVIMTTYPGASPEKVEAEISKPLEQSMSTLEHIKEVTSTSSENYSVVMLEFEESVNMDTIGVDIQQKITALQGSWDDVVGSPYVLKINPDLLPVEVAAVAMDGKDTVALTEFLSDTLMPKLEGISGVARITASGTVEQQLHVVLDQQKIDRTNLKIANAINGKLDDAANELLEKRDELTDAQDQIDTARLQLDSGKASLSSSTASAEAELSQKQAELISAKSELQNQITQLQASKTQVETILTPLRAIRDALNNAAAQSNPLQEELNTLYALRDSAYSLQAREDAFYAQIQAIYDDPELSDEDKQAAVDALYAGEEYAAITADRATLDAELAVRGFGSIEDVNVRIAQLETEIADINAKVESFRQQLADLGIELNLLDSKIAELESQVSQIDETINYLQLDVLPQLDSGMLQLKDATRILSQQKTSGMLEISGAMADLAANAAGLDSALAQMDTGLDSIESSRQEALDKADLNGILSMEMISGILQAQSFYMPAGYVAQDGISYMVSVGEEITDLETLQNLPLFDLGIDGVEPVRLQDVAEVFLTDNRNETYARLNGQESIVLSFEKQSTYSTAGATANVNARFRQLEEQYPGLRFVALMDQGDYIHLIVDNILNSLLLGAVFAILILFLFLRDIRPTFITLCSIPISVIFAIVLMYFSGVTINMISLSGLAVAVGMLVDNSIVVIENIYRLRAKGVSAAKAAVAGAAQVAGAVTSSTLTTVCVFLPIVFIEGITRQLFTDLALTMSYSLLASLIVSLTLVPAMASGMMRRQKKEKKGRVSAGLLRGYEKIAGFALDHKALVLLIAVAALAATGYLALARGFTFMPEMDMPSLTLTIAMPEDSTMEEAAALSDQVLTRINAMDGIETAGAMMSTGTASLLGMGGSGGSHDVTVYITLADDTASGAQMGQRIIDECADLNCEITSSSAMMDMSMLTGSGISLELYGQDMDALQAAARTAAEALRGVEGVASVSDGLEDAAPALHIQIDRDMAMSQGLTIAQVYAQHPAGQHPDPQRHQHGYRGGAPGGGPAGRRAAEGLYAGGHGYERRGPHGKAVRRGHSGGNHQPDLHQPEEPAPLPHRHRPDQQRLQCDPGHRRRLPDRGDSRFGRGHQLCLYRRERKHHGRRGAAAAHAGAGHPAGVSGDGGPVPEPEISVHRHVHHSPGLHRRLYGAADLPDGGQRDLPDRLCDAHRHHREQRHRSGGLHQPAPCRWNGAPGSHPGGRTHPHPPHSDDLRHHHFGPDRHGSEQKRRQRHDAAHGRGVHRRPDLRHADDPAGGPLHLRHLQQKAPQSSV